MNDDENDEKPAIGEALSTVNESPSFDVSRVIQNSQCEWNNVPVMCW